MKIPSPTESISDFFIKQVVCNQLHVEQTFRSKDYKYRECHIRLTKSLFLLPTDKIFFYSLKMTVRQKTSFSANHKRRRFFFSHQREEEKKRLSVSDLTFSHLDKQSYSLKSLYVIMTTFLDEITRTLVSFFSFSQIEERRGGRECTQMIRR